MSLYTYLKLTKVIFFLVGLFHGLRLLNGWEVVIGGWTVPMWFSIVGLLVTWYLAFSSWTLLKKTKKK